MRLPRGLALHQHIDFGSQVETLERSGCIVSADEAPPV